MFSNIYLGNFVLSATLDLGRKSCTVGINLTAAAAAAALRVITPHYIYYTFFLTLHAAPCLTYFDFINGETFTNRLNSLSHTPTHRPPPSPSGSSLRGSSPSPQSWCSWREPCGEPGSRWRADPAGPSSRSECRGEANGVEDT